MKKLLFIPLLSICLAFVNVENERPKKRKPVNKSIPIRKIYKNDTTLYSVPVYRKNNWLITINTITGKKDTVMVNDIN